MRVERQPATTVAEVEAAPVSASRRALLARGGMIAMLAGSGLGGFASAGNAWATGADPLFDATTMDEVVRALGGSPAASSAIELELPDLTENGAMVPIAVTSRMPRTTQIMVLADANPFPLAATFDVVPGTEPYIATRVKLAQSCTVWAVVRADGRTYWVSGETAVTLGGCGG